MSHPRDHSETAVQGFGPLLRSWRRRRALSQLTLALSADISQRHLSFLESGRSQPSRAMVSRLAEQLDLPLRDRNRLMSAAGYATAYRARALDDPQLADAWQAIDTLLEAHAPYPALVLDAGWHLIKANAAVSLLTEGIAGHLLVPPVNVLRLSLHPDGLAPRIVNLAQWRSHVMARLHRQAHSSDDPAIDALFAELQALGDTADTTPAAGDDSQDAADAIALPLELDTPRGRLSLITTTTVFGTATDITLSELTIETFFPGDDCTRALLMAAD